MAARARQGGGGFAHAATLQSRAQNVHRSVSEVEIGLHVVGHTAEILNRQYARSINGETQNIQP